MPVATKKDALKKIAADLLCEKSKVDNAYRNTLDLNFYHDVPLIDNSDCERIKRRKDVIDAVYQELFNAIAPFSTADQKYIPVSGNLQEHINKHIDTLDEKQAEAALKSFTDENSFISQLTQPMDKSEMVKPDCSPFSTDKKDQAKNISAIRGHTIDGGWALSFFSKIINLAKEALGVKTSSEKVLDSTMELARSSLS